MSLVLFCKSYEEGPECYKRILEHPLRKKSRYYTAHGIPDQLFFLPESVGAVNYQKRCDQANMDEIERHINTENEDESDPIYQEYFEYCSAMLGFQEPNTWRDSLAMFQRLIEVAEQLIELKSEKMQ